jgi:hypothetical membrane protein
MRSEMAAEHHEATDGSTTMAARTARLGLASVAVILGTALVTAIVYSGAEGEAYSPLNHFVSELGELAHSRLAAVFNLGLIGGGGGLGLFVVLVSRSMRRPYGPAFAISGVVASVSGSLVGVFPMDYLDVHRAVAAVFFDSGWIIVLVFTAWQLRTPGAHLPPGLAVLAGLVVASFVAFLAAIAATPASDALEPIADRPSFWIVPALEWAALLTLLAWFGALSLVGLAAGAPGPRRP